MKQLSGADAFIKLREMLSGSLSYESFSFTENAFERVRISIDNQLLSGIEKAIRLRHALRFASISVFNDTNITLPFGNLFGSKNVTYEKVGLVLQSSGLFKATPWMPNWIENSSSNGVDYYSCGEFPRPWTTNSISSDPWLKDKFKLLNYKGPGQALAVRTALGAPVGNVQIIVLPTGEGKSLVFQSIALANPGKTTIVVVPTVALEQDHEISAKKIQSFSDKSYAYIGGDDHANSSIIQGILDGTQQLVFTSPEALVTTLKRPIIEASSLGRISGIVIDEAHLVNSWGTDFRVEFQLIGAIYSEALRNVPPSGKFNLICLTATLSNSSYDLLNALFGGDSNLAVTGSVRLRPEIDIWIDKNWPIENIRVDRVLEALYHLPRPAILYVTKPEEAEWWSNQLTNLGFRNYECLHGETSNKQKQKVIEKWRRGDLDLVIGTSAFGLGIDYSNVRSIIHACLPESIDRYYQEIGRAGRDNKACTGIMIPSSGDISIARSQRRKLISIEKGYTRWQSMFSQKVEFNKSGIVTLDISTSPTYDRDMKGSTSEMWNLQVLSLMARCKLIEIYALKGIQDNKKLLDIKIINPDHMDILIWREIVEPLRKKIQVDNLMEFSFIFELINNNHQCASTIFTKTYQVRVDNKKFPVTPACGGCPFCRKNNITWFSDWPNAPYEPWSIGILHKEIFPELLSDNIFVQLPQDIKKRSSQRELGEFIGALWKIGWKKFLSTGDVPAIIYEQLLVKPWACSIGGGNRNLSANGLPTGPELILISEDNDLNSHNVATYIRHCPRIYLIPFNCMDPRYPEDFLSERKNVMQLKEILNRIKQ
jgi:ATP-dependent DNA helicase RecQ